MTSKAKRRTFQRPALMTERIEVRCSVAEKDAIYAASLVSGKPVSRYLVEAAMNQVDKHKPQGVTAHE